MRDVITREEARAIAKMINADIEPYLKMHQERYMQFLAEHYADEYNKQHNSPNEIREEKK